MTATFAVVRKDISRDVLIPTKNGVIPEKYRDATFLVLSQDEKDGEFNLKIRCAGKTFCASSIDFAFFTSRQLAFKYLEEVKSKSMMRISINSFTREVIVSSDTEEVRFNYEDVDWWFSFSLDGKVYDFHILYDSGLEVSVYPVENNVVDYSIDIPISLNVIF